jgi:hypothetical protein
MFEQFNAKEHCTRVTDESLAAQVAGRMFDEIFNMDVAAVSRRTSAVPIQAKDAAITDKEASASTVDGKEPWRQDPEKWRNMQLDEVTNRNVLPSYLSSFVTSQFLAVRYQVARNQRTMSADLARLATDPDLDVRGAVAANYRTLPVTLTQLAADPNHNVREYVAQNCNILPTDLTRLSADPIASVRCACLRNPRTLPPADLTRLASDPDSEVRCLIASNPHTPLADLTRLASDPASDVRCRIAGNTHTPLADLTRLASDPDSEVRRLIASNPHTLLADLTRLASDPASDVRCRIAGNTHTPLADLTRLASDPDSGVRFTVVHNRNIPLADIISLCSDRDEDVRQTARKVHPLDYNPGQPRPIADWTRQDVCGTLESWRYSDGSSEERGTSNGGTCTLYRLDPTGRHTDTFRCSRDAHHSSVEVQHSDGSMFRFRAGDGSFLHEFNFKPDGSHETGVIPQALFDQAWHNYNRLIMH